MKLVTCMGATSGMKRIRTVPLLVVMRTKYFLPAVNFTGLGIGSAVFQPAAFLSTLAAEICASMALTEAPADPLAGLAGLSAASAARATPAKHVETARASRSEDSPLRFIEKSPPVWAVRMLRETRVRRWRTEWPGRAARATPRRREPYSAGPLTGHLTTILKAPEDWITA